MGSFRLDVVWQRCEEACPVYVFEIHLAGNLSEALTRLKCAWQKFGNPKLYLITDTRSMDRIRKLVLRAYSEIADSIRICDFKEIQEFYERLIGCDSTGEKVGFRRLRFRKRENSSNPTQKLHDSGCDPSAPNSDFELVATLFPKEGKKIVLDIMDFIKSNGYVDEDTVSEAFEMDLLKSHVVLRFFWKKGYLKRTRRKSDGEWLFSLR